MFDSLIAVGFGLLAGNRRFDVELGLKRVEYGQILHAPVDEARGRSMETYDIDRTSLEQEFLG